MMQVRNKDLGNIWPPLYTPELPYMCVSLRLGVDDDGVFRTGTGLKLKTFMLQQFDLYSR